MATWQNDKKNMNNWLMNSSLAIYSITYDEASDTNTIVYTGKGGHERFYLEVDVEAFKNYSMKFSFCSPTGFEYGGYDNVYYDFGFVSVVNSTVLNANGAETYEIEQYRLNRSESYDNSQREDMKDFEIVFNSLSNTKVYLIIDLGYILDDVQITFKIGNLSFAEVENTYSNVKEIFDNGLKNMTKLRGTTRDDDSTFSYSTGVSWLKFKGVTVDTIYLSSNSYVGISENSEQFKFNRRDMQSRAMFYEMGALKNGFKFLKIRWEGYSNYSSSYYGNNDYFQAFDLIFMETGDIILNAAAIPKNYYDGTNELVAQSTYSYERPTTENRYVTFYTQDDNNNTFEVAYELPTYNIKKWLFKSNNEYYTVVDNALSKVDIGENITSNDFLQYGFSNVPNYDVYASLDNLEVCYWQDNEDTIPTIRASLDVQQFSKSIISNKIDLSHSSIKGIENVTVDCDGELIVAVSFDEQATWQAWNGSEWITLSEQFSGMSKDTLESITVDQWNMIFSKEFGMYLRASFIASTQIIRKIYISFVN